jgi:hypothetical protein
VVWCGVVWCGVVWCGAPNDGGQAIKRRGLTFDPDGCVACSHSVKCILDLNQLPRRAASTEERRSVNEWVSKEGGG